MEVVLSVLVYLFIIGCVLLLPFLLYISVFVFSANIPSLAIINQVTYAAEDAWKSAPGIFRSDRVKPV